MAKPAAQDRRIEAITAVNECFRDTHNQQVPTGAVVVAIRKLAPLGRTERWKQAVDDWARLVEEHPENRRWACYVGAIFTAHRA
jgi:hypothetical protein